MIHFEGKCPEADMKIPEGALRLSGFDSGEKLEYHPQANALVVLKKRMTALDLIRAAWSLRQLSDALTAHLVELEPQSDCCEDCSSCPYGFEDFAHEFNFPPEILERACIPNGAILHMEFPESGEICISTNQDGPGLWDIPSQIMRELLAAGICPAGLEMLIESGDLVYGA